MYKQISDWFGVCERNAVSRKAKSDVLRWITAEDLILAVNKRGWHLLEVGDQFVMITRAPFAVLA